MSRPTLLILIILIVVLCTGGWGFRSGWYGRYPYAYGGGGVLGLLLLILLVMLILGYW